VVFNLIQSLSISSSWFNRLFIFDLHILFFVINWLDGISRGRINDSSWLFFDLYLFFFVINWLDDISRGRINDSSWLLFNLYILFFVIN
jgi:hypothetical protein